MLCFYFEDKTVSRIRCNEKSEWTWSEIVKLVNENREPIINDEWYNELDLDLHFNYIW